MYAHKNIIILINMSNDLCVFRTDRDNYMVNILNIYRLNV